MASNITLLALRDACKDRADMQNSNFVSDSEWNRYINSAAKELYGLLTSKGLLYTTVSDTISTNGTDDTYSLPSDFYKLSGVDYNVDGLPYPMEAYTFEDRHRFTDQSPQQILRYLLVGQDKIRFNPVPNPQTITIWYEPVLATLASDGDTFNGINGWEEYVIVRAAMWALLKEESDVSALASDLAFLRDRIETESNNRDQGPAGMVTDVNRDFDKRRLRWEW